MSRAAGEKKGTPDCRIVANYISRRPKVKSDKPKSMGFYTANANL